MRLQLFTRNYLLTLPNKTIFFANTRKRTQMVDFAREQVIGLRRLSKRLDVSQDTIRRWFKQGLEHQKIGSKLFTTLEAMNRFAGQQSHQIDDQSELAEEMQTAARRGM